MKVGQAITYIDEYGKKRAALITRIGWDDPKTWINLVIVSANEDQTDDYGRKLERRSSVPAWSEGWTGNYWIEA